MKFCNLTRYSYLKNANLILCYQTLQYTLFDFTETWEYFITCLPPHPWFISVPYLTTPLKISNLAFFAFLKRIFPPTIVLWLEMMTMLSPTRFYQMYLFIALEIFQNKNNMIWQKKLKQGLLKSFTQWTEERHFFKKDCWTSVTVKPNSPEPLCLQTIHLPGFLFT